LSQELAALIPGAKLKLIEAAGHLANAEQSALFNAIVDAFLAGVVRNSS
jgi:pimeloyl-ACP methyl ester carboxylesterase